MQPCGFLTGITMDLKSNLEAPVYKGNGLQYWQLALREDIIILQA